MQVIGCIIADFIFPSILNCKLHKKKENFLWEKESSAVQCRRKRRVEKKKEHFSVCVFVHFEVRTSEQEKKQKLKNHHKILKKILKKKT